MINFISLYYIAVYICANKHTNTMKKQLINGECFTYKSENNIMELSYSKSLSGKMYFKVEFNGKLDMFRTFEAFEKLVKYYIDKYGLQLYNVSPLCVVAD